MQTRHIGAFFVVIESRINLPAHLPAPHWQKHYHFQNKFKTG